MRSIVLNGCYMITCTLLIVFVLTTMPDISRELGKVFTINSNVSMVFDPHTKPHYGVTPSQLTFFLLWCGCWLLWVIRYLKGTGSGSRASSDDEESAKGLREHNQDFDKSVNNSEDKTREKAEVKLEIGNNVKHENGKPSSENGNNTNAAKKFSAVKPPPTFDEFLQKVVIFGIILIYFYACDYRKVFPLMEREYSRDTFLFLVFLLFLVACCFTLKPTKDVILNRDQTEEWKGWMQVMFVWYHVFAAKEWYNWIRVYIAAYVWMTGFGNFSFFWIRKDFTLWRFLKMQFRLNFLVACICVATSNEYMLYYICAMHSYWFITVYIFMRVLNSWNTDSKKMAAKFFAYFLFNAAIYEVPIIRDNIFRPLWPVLQYHDPRFDNMHEWVFRSGLDHWACFTGMLCAYNYPHFETFIKNVEKNTSTMGKLVPKLLMIVAAVIALVAWYVLFMGKEKFAYNTVHPYTSIIPIVAFIVLRNAFPLLRTYYVGLFTWLGKITLETYLCQLHIYLQSNAKHLIGYIPGYPLLNFSLSTIIYLPIAYVLFNLTTDFSAYLIPKDMKTVFKNAMIIVAIVVVPTVVISLIYLGSHWWDRLY